MKERGIKVYHRIGVLGVHRTSGVTHITLLLAQYLRGCLGYPVTIIEESGRRDYLSFLSHDAMTCTDREAFYYHGIRFLKKEQMLSQKFEEEECVLFDFGTNRKGMTEYLDKLDRVITLFTAAPWYHAGTLLWEHGKMGEDIKNEVLLLNLATKEALINLPKLPQKPKILGFEPNVFKPTKEAIKVAETLLCSNR